MSRKTEQHKKIVEAIEILPQEASSELDFHGWLITTKGMGSKWAQVIDTCVNKILRDNNCPFPTRKDVDDMAVKVWSSSYSKSHQRHLLIGLEYYCEWRGMKVKFRKPRATKRSPHYLTQAQMKQLVHSARDFREYASLKLLCSTGIRLNEFRMLNIGDVNLAMRSLTVRHAKRDKDRELPLSSDTCKLIAAYIAKYHTDPQPQDPLFLSARGTRWSPNAIADSVKRCAQRAGIKEKVTPHMLRHSFATAMLGNGCDLFHLSHMLGHQDIGTTTIYLHVNDKAMRQAYERGVPRI